MLIRTVFATLLCLALVLATSAPCLAADSFYPFVYSAKGDILLAEKPGQKPKKLGKGYDASLSSGANFAVWVEKVSDKNDRLVIREMASGKSWPLTQQDGYLHTPRWSPKENVVLYARRVSGKSELWTVRPSGIPVMLATADNATGNDFFEPVWTPDGEGICYHDMSYYYQMAPNGKVVSKTQLSAFGDKNMFTSADRFSPRPNAKGTLAFTMSVPGSKLFQKKVSDMNTAVFIYDGATKTVTRITGENMTAFAPVWSPNGEELLFTGYTDVQAGGAYPFRVFSLRPGAQPVELYPGEGPMPVPGK
ncbi:MAG: biopolymer transporter Tol [Desulfovibrio sp.]|nr:biopolymer transporter Tol [Desulfovibrio sp.]